MTDFILKLKSLVCISKPSFIIFNILNKSSIIFFTLFGYLNINVVSSQEIENCIEYYKIINEAEEKFCLHKYEESSKIYDKAISSSFKRYRDIINYARCKIASQKFDTMELRSLILTNANLRGPYLSSNIKNDTLLCKINSDSFFQNLQEIESTRKKIFPEEIQVLIDLDQYIRNGPFSYETMNYIDSFILQRLVNYISVNGWPGYNKFGTDNAASILVHHSSSLKFETLDSLLINEVINGNLEPIHYGLFKDRHYANKKECGYGLGYSKKYCNDELFVRQRQISIGLYVLSSKHFRTYKLECEK